MFLPSPPVDTRSAADVVASTTALVQAYTMDTTDPAAPVPGWAPPAGSPDVASALIRIFAVMAKYLIDRINLFPDNAFLAFLNMVGVAPTPPQPALVPLTFSLANGTTAGVLVPAGTQVGAAPLPTDAGPVTFETTQDLVVTPAQLVSVLSYEPSVDLYADNTAQATGASTGVDPAFAGQLPLEHDLYLSADAVLALPAGTPVTMKIQLVDPGTGTSAAAWQALNLTWSYWSGGTNAKWTLLPLTSSSPTTSSVQLVFALPNDMAATTVNGQSARWIRAKLPSWPAFSVPEVQSVTLASTAVPLPPTAPDAAVSTGGPIDLTADFFPFGAQPQFNSAFYLASAAALSTPGATVTVTLNVTLSDQHNTLSSTDNPTVAWEVWTGSAWVEVGRSTRSSAFAGSYTNTSAFADNTFAFTASSTVTFTLPANVAATTVQGSAGSWLRIRLVGGNNPSGPGGYYGLGVTLASGASGTLTATNDGYRPPILKSVTLGYTITPSATAAGFAYNDLTFTRFAPPSFVPFVRMPDTDPALYLGFDRAFENRPTLLYVQIAPLSISDLETLGDVTSPPTVEWEYWGAAGDWAPLGATDATGSFAESGLVSFIGPSDFTSTTVLGQARYWLRARLDQGQFAAPPRVGLVLTNTVWASNTATTQAEILGSSDGTPSQTFTLLHTPVLEGQRIYVNEPALPPPAEQAAIEALEGSDAILVVPGVRGQPDQTWVRWHVVTDFYGSGPRDRHYVIDRDAGVVTFGDGLHGLVPPQGTQNVWSFFYQTGGGSQGNRPAGTVNQLKTAIASIGGVINFEEASGGSDTESLDEVKVLGPTVLRNSGRAIAAQDYQDLALQASPDVARAQLVPPNFDPTQNPIEAPEAGHVTLLVVPFSNDMPPTPGVGLLRELTTHLQARIAPAVTLTVTGPLWIQVSVSGLTIVPVTTEGADPLRVAAVAAITGFLHPLTGGFDGTGWAFGQLPQASDIYRLVMAIPGVNAVQGFILQTAPPPDMTNPDVANRVLIYSGTHTVVITAPDAGG